MSSVHKVLQAGFGMQLDTDVIPAWTAIFHTVKYSQSAVVRLRRAARSSLVPYPAWPAVSSGSLVFPYGRIDIWKQVKGK